VLLKVIFFELNGLRHREFKPDGVNPLIHTIEFIRWNTESNLVALAVNADSRQPPDQAESRVQLWHRCNYHWYLKHEVIVSGSVTQLLFDPESPYRLYMASNGTGQCV
jgi:elongator complex protein 1